MHWRHKTSFYFNVRLKWSKLTHIIVMSICLESCVFQRTFLTENILYAFLYLLYITHYYVAIVVVVIVTFYIIPFMFFVRSIPWGPSAYKIVNTYITEEHNHIVYKIFIWITIVVLGINLSPNTLIYLFIHVPLHVSLSGQ